MKSYTPRDGGRRSGQGQGYLVPGMVCRLQIVYWRSEMITREGTKNGTLVEISWSRQVEEIAPVAIFLCREFFHVGVCKRTVVHASTTIRREVSTTVPCGRPELPRQCVCDLEITCFRFWFSTTCSFAFS